MRLPDIQMAVFFLVQPGVWTMNLLNTNTFHRQSLHFLHDTHGFGDGFLWISLQAYMAQHHLFLFLFLFSSRRLVVYSVQ